MVPKANDTRERRDARARAQPDVWTRTGGDNAPKEPCGTRGTPTREAATAPTSALSGTVKEHSDEFRFFCDGNFPMALRWRAAADLRMA